LSRKISFHTIIAAFTVIFIVFKLVFAAHAADVAKIGVIDVQKIIAFSSIGKSAKVELERIEKKYEADLKKKKAEIEDAKQRLEREGLMLSKNVIRDKERELRIMINNYKALQKKYRVEFQQHVIRLDRRIKKEIMAIAEKIGRKGGYLLIIDKQRAGVMYSSDTVDITDDILQQFIELSF